MPPENPMNSDDDIQQALSQAQNLESGKTDAEVPKAPSGEVLAHSGRCPMRWLQYGVYKCGLMAEKYPWQTTAALLLTTGCGWLCSYFGVTVLAVLVVIAVTAEE